MAAASRSAVSSAAQSAAGTGAGASRAVSRSSSNSSTGGGGGGGAAGALQRLGSGRRGWDLVGSNSTSAVPALATTASSMLLPVATAEPSNTTQWGSKVRVGSNGGGSRVRRSMSGGRGNGSLKAPAKGSLGSAAKRIASGETLLLADANSLSYLDGSLPGDMGFDPLGLFSPENDAGFINQRWLRYSEVLHGRWAMLGVVGCLAPEMLQYEGIIPQEHGIVWYKTGFLPTAGQDYDFGTDLVSLSWIMMIAMGFAETRRLQDFNNPGSLATGHTLPLVLERALSTPPGCDPVYPGGPIFNFMGVVETDSALARFKEMEIKHGRLAMVAMLGLFAQAAATHDGPYINLLDHMFDPLGSNIFTNLPYINE